MVVWTRTRGGGAVAALQQQVGGLLTDSSGLETGGQVHQVTSTPDSTTRFLMDPGWTRFQGFEA